MGFLARVTDLVDAVSGDRARREAASEKAELLTGMGDFLSDRGEAGLAQWHWREAGIADARSNRRRFGSGR